MRCLLTIFVLVTFTLGQTINKWNGVTIGTATGNVSKLNGITIGNAAGNISKLNGISLPVVTGTTPTVSQKCASSGSATTIACTLTTVTGHAVFVFCATGQTTGQTFAVSDGGTNTYSSVGTANTTQTSEGAGRWLFAKSITGVNHAITCSSDGGSRFRSIFVYEIAGASASSPVDVPTGATTGAGGTSSATPSYTLPATTHNWDLLLFASQCGNTCSADAAADAGTSQSDGGGDESETYAKTTTGTYTGQFSQTAGAYMVLGVAVTDGN